MKRWVEKERKGGNVCPSRKDDERMTCDRAREKGAFSWERRRERSSSAPPVPSPSKRRLVGATLPLWEECPHLLLPRSEGKGRREWEGRCNHRLSGKHCPFFVHLWQLLDHELIQKMRNSIACGKFVYLEVKRREGDGGGDFTRQRLIDHISAFGSSLWRMGSDSVPNLDKESREPVSSPPLGRFPYLSEWRIFARALLVEGTMRKQFVFPFSDSLRLLTPRSMESTEGLDPDEERGVIERRTVCTFLKEGDDS